MHYNWQKPQKPPVLSCMASKFCPLDRNSNWLVCAFTSLSFTDLQLNRFLIFIKNCKRRVIINHTPKQGATPGWHTWKKEDTVAFNSPVCAQSRLALQKLHTFIVISRISKKPNFTVSGFTVNASLVIRH